MSRWGAAIDHRRDRFLVVRQDEPRPGEDEPRQYLLAIRRTLSEAQAYQARIEGQLTPLALPSRVSVLVAQIDPLQVDRYRLPRAA